MGRTSSDGSQSSTQFSGRRGGAGEGRVGEGGEEHRCGSGPWRVSRSFGVDRPAGQPTWRLHLPLSAHKGWC